MKLTEDTERFNDIDYVDPDDEPICVCADYIGTTHVTFCRSCMDWTDNIEIAKMEAAEKPAAVAVSAERKPAASERHYAFSEVA